MPTLTADRCCEQVEIDEECQRLMRMHWNEEKDGHLVQLSDVRDLAAQADVLGGLQEVCGMGDLNIDLCIGGWPCNVRSRALPDAHPERLPLFVSSRGLTDAGPCRT